MGIIGENLEIGLSNQIKVRQKKLGNPTPTTEDAIFNNSKATWLRVASSVDINDINLAGLGDFAENGSELAKNLVLFSGAINSKGTLPNKALSTSTNNLSEQVLAQYGIGNSTQWGYSPPPGIESISVQALNRGAIRKANISLKAHNPDQFRLIEALYLRLGFTILVEWGHTVYYDNDENLQLRQDFSTIPFEQFMNKTGDFSSITEALIDERKRSSYNYDGFIGYISNFNWSFNDDATYTINLDIITRGGLIDSLTVNRSGAGGDIPGTGNGSLLETIFQNWKEVVKGQNFDAITTYGTKFFTNTPDDDANQLWGFPFIKEGEFVSIAMETQADGESTEAPQYYISLGLLLRFINDRGLLYSTEADLKNDPEFRKLNLDEQEQRINELKLTPIISIDHRYGKSWMLSHPYQQSTDPKICYLNNSLPQASYVFKKSEDLASKARDLEIVQKYKGNGNFTNGGNVSTPSAPIDAVGAKPDNLFRPKSNNSFAADIMGIMLNLDFLIKVLNDSKDENGNVSLGDYINNILGPVSSVTGNINSFSTSYSEETNTVVIYDDTTIPGISPGASEATSIHVYGLGSKNSQKGSSLELGSFVRSLNFSSKIFPKLQNSIAIAAQNPDGGTTGEKISSFQRLNKGLVDRIARGAKPYFISGKNEPPSPMARFESEIFLLNDHFITQYNKGFLRSQKEIDECSNTLRDLLAYDLEWRAGAGEITSPFFIPVELSLTMDGIAGFKLYEKFDISPDYILPPSYPDNVNFIIQGVSHDLNGGDWKTVVNTLSWPAEKNAPFNPSGNIIVGERNSATEPPSVPTAQPVFTPTGESLFTDPTLEPLLVISSTSAQENFGITPGTVVTPEQAVQYLHPQVRQKQLTFLTYMLQEPALRGARIEISSTLRTFAQQNNLFVRKVTTAPAGTSQHNYGCAFDLNIYDQKTGKLIASNNFPGPNIHTKETWVNLGIVNAAKNADVSSWGGNFNSYFDPVHFGVKVNTAASLETAKNYANQKGINYKTLGVNDIFNLDITFA